MNARILVSTCALLVSAYGITPAVAESFNDRGGDWTQDSPAPTTATASHPQTLPPAGSFASAWNKGSEVIPSSGNPASPAADLATGQRCEAPPRVGFNQRNAFPTC